MNGLLRVASGVWLVCWAILTGAQDMPAPPAQPSQPPPQPGPANQDLQPVKKVWPERNPRPQPKYGRRRGKVLEQVMLARLSEELELSDEQTVLMVRRFMDFRNKRDDLRREREKLTHFLREALDNDEPDSKLEELLNQIRDLHETLIRQQRGLYEDLSRDMSARQRAKLFLFLERFEAEVQQTLRRTAEQRLGPPTPPPPGGQFPPMGMMPPGPPAGSPGPPIGTPPPPPEGPAPAFSPGASPPAPGPPRE